MPNFRVGARKFRQLALIGALRSGRQNGFDTKGAGRHNCCEIWPITERDRPTNNATVAANRKLWGAENGSPDEVQMNSNLPAQSSVGGRDTRPFVSVIIPAYNAEPTLARAINSVFAQNYPNVEIIVIDDCSKDGTSQIATGFNRKEIRLLRHEKNAGECGAMNSGIAIAQGKYVAFLDADDEWRPTKLEKQIEALERNPSAVFATCACEFVGTDGVPYMEFGMPPAEFRKKELWRQLLVRSCVAKPCVVAHLASLKAAGSFDTSLRIAGDQDMWIRLSRLGEVEFIPEFLTVVHDTPHSLTKVYGRRLADYLLPMVSRHVESLRPELTPSEVRSILGERYTSVGRILYVNGNFWRGLGLILQGSLQGTKVRENAWYLMTASPVARSLKQTMKRIGASRA